MPLSPSYSQVLQSCPGVMGHHPPPPVPLELPEARTLKESEYLKMDLTSNPGKATSETYSINVPYFSHGLSYEWILFLKTFEKVVKGQNLTSAVAKYTMMRMLLQGDALRVFESKVTGLVETQANFVDCLNAVSKHEFPCHALLRQKRYMRHYMCKPRSMKMREYATTVIERRDDFKYFPDYTTADKFDDDKLCDVVEFGSPAVWQNTMLIQGFDITDHTLDKLVDSVSILNPWRSSMMLT